MLQTEKNWYTMKMVLRRSILCTAFSKGEVGVRPEHMVLDENGVVSKIEVNELMGSSVHLHIDIEGKDVIVIVSTMNMTGAEVEALKAGAQIKVGFAGNVCHVFSKETGINLEA